MIRVIIIVIAALLVVFLAAGFIAGNYFYSLALNPGTDKSSVMDAPHNEIDNSGTTSGDSATGAEWFEAVSKTDEYMTSYDGLGLHAYYVEQEEESHRYAVVCHGYTGRANQMGTSAMQFYQRGYHILIPNARGHGQSEGDYIGMGWHDRLDIVDWIGQIVEKDPQAQIVLYGVSMGGATVMMVSGEDLPGNVKAIVEDCGYTSVWDEFSYQLNEIFGLPDFPIMNFASAVTNIRAGYTLEEASAVKQVEKSITPMMFIHGDSDTFVPSYMVDEVYDACGAEKEKLIVEGAGHGMAASIMGEAYWEQVMAFLNNFVDG